MKKPPKRGPRLAPSIDFAAIKSRAEPLIVEILEELAPDGDLRGNEYLMYNPHRNDGELGSFSYNVDKHVYADFADDEVKGSDIVSLAAFLLGIKPSEAAIKVLETVERLESEGDAAPEAGPATSKARPKRKQKPSKPPSTAIVPIPGDAPAPPSEHPVLGKPSACYQYNDASGRTVCLIYRFDPLGQGKTIRPLTYRRIAEGNTRWEWLGLDDARPLYNLYELVQRPDASVLIVEGEKSADAARSLFPDRVVVTTAGGSGAADKSDLNPLKGRSILIWPDNDEAGQKYLKTLVTLLQAQDDDADLSVLKIPDVSPCLVDGKATLKPGFVAPEGWDAADAVEEGWTAEHVQLLLNQFGAIRHKAYPLAASPSGNAIGVPMPDVLEKFLEKNFVGGLLYCNETFLTYAGGYWRRLDQQAHIRLAIARFLGKSAMPNAISTIQVLLQDFHATDNVAFVPDKSMVCMKNGSLNTETFRLEDHSPDHGLVNALDIDWDPEAKCDRWLQFLDEIFANDPDKDQKIGFLQEWFGYCLTPDVSYHHFVWMVGSGGNGKSVLLSVLEALVGLGNVGHAQMERFESGSVRAELEGKLLNISSEMSATATVSDGYLKKITGGDSIEAERKFKQPHSFKSTVKLVAATNTLPRLLDNSDGFARRAVILTFNRRFSQAEMDPKLPKLLLNELAGVAVWAIDGLKNLRSRGRFEIPPSALNELAAYRADSDPVAHFIKDCLTQSAEKLCPPSRVYESYAQWAKDSGLTPLSIINFGKRLTAHGFEKYRTGGKDYWRLAVDIPDKYDQASTFSLPVTDSFKPASPSIVVMRNKKHRL